ncbi:UTP--glucose-1-phosphate uridylyltransferase GalU [Helicovermis profundi]|uniref:UTP--glucose-1-phosphate uridylyltransferase n=1 Tax=Helicovermis profundi TaxID=3065157 RepID=A0AAU9E9B6_9FIRM|nr:UTP--glucose-1-phosphate uridylyltransferase GalU [Clostridia bacterium S502]
MKVKKAIIPAAGFGTRLLPATKAIPKEMIPIVDKPAIQYIVEEAINSGIEEILIINGRNKDSIENHFDISYELESVLREKNKTKLLKISEDISNMANIHFVRQKEAKGLGHAVLCAKAFVGDEPFAVLLGDDIVDNDYPCLKQLMDVYEKYESSVIGVQTVNRDQVDKYGIIDAEKIDERTYKVKDMVEKPDIESAPSNVAVLGRYVLDSEIFNILEKVEPGKGGEIQLTDGIRELMKSKDVYAYDFLGTRYDTGDKLGFIKATIELGLKHEEIKDNLKEYLSLLAKKL